MTGSLTKSARIDGIPKVQVKVSSLRNNCIIVSVGREIRDPAALVSLNHAGSLYNHARCYMRGTKVHGAQLSLVLS